MQATFKLTKRDLTDDFIKSLKKMFPNGLFELVGQERRALSADDLSPQAADSFPEDERFELKAKTKREEIQERFQAVRTGEAPVYAFTTEELELYSERIASGEQIDLSELRKEYLA